MSVCIVVPTYNEAENIADAILEIGRALAGVPHTVIVVDDNSPDGTADIARQFGAHVVVRPRRLGVGTAVLVGYADQSHTMPIGQYASVRVIDLDNPFRDWSNPVWVECNVTQPSIIDPFMNNTVFHLAYSIEYSYGWLQPLVL